MVILHDKPAEVVVQDYKLLSLSSIVTYLRCQVFLSWFCEADACYADRIFALLLARTNESIDIALGVSEDVCALFFLFIREDLGILRTDLPSVIEFEGLIAILSFNYQQHSPSLIKSLGLDRLDVEKCIVQVAWDIMDLPCILNYSPVVIHNLNQEQVIGDKLNLLKIHEAFVAEQADLAAARQRLDDEGVIEVLTLIFPLRYEHLSMSLVDFLLAENLPLILDALFFQALLTREVILLLVPQIESLSLKLD